MFPWKQINESGCGLVPHNGCRHRACSCWLMWGSRGVLCFVFYLGAKGRARDTGKSLPAMQWNSTCLLGSLGTAADQGEDLLPRWCPLVLGGDVELCPSLSSFPPPFPSSFQMVTPPRSSGVSPTQHTCKSWGSAAWCWLSGCQQSKSLHRWAAWTPWKELLWICPWWWPAGRRWFMAWSGRNGILETHDYRDRT